MMTLNQLRENLRSEHGNKRMISENHRTSFDDFFDKWTGYMREGITHETPLSESEITNLTEIFLDSIDTTH